MPDDASSVVQWIANATDLVAVVMILIGFVRGVIGWVRAEMGPGEGRWERIQGVRCTMGTYLLLGIEFMIVSDILHSCVHRDFKSLGELGALVVIRTVISFFLGKELESVHAVEKSA